MFFLKKKQKNWGGGGKGVNMYIKHTNKDSNPFISFIILSPLTSSLVVAGVLFLLIIGFVLMKNIKGKKYKVKDGKETWTPKHKKNLFIHSFSFIYTLLTTHTYTHFHVNHKVIKHLPCFFFFFSFFPSCFFVKGREGWGRYAFSDNINSFCFLLTNLK